MAKKKTTKSFEKVWNFYLNTIEKEDFHAFVSSIRKRNAIPEQGYPKESYEQDEYEYEVRFMPPKAWSDSKTENEIESLDKDIETMVRHLKMGPFVKWLDILKWFIFYNIIRLPEDRDLLVVEDVPRAGREKKKESSMFDEGTHPIALRISPYASKNDTIDFIEKKYRTDIAPLQTRYGNREIVIGNTKIKDSLKRAIHDFIYRLKGKPRKQIQTDLADRLKKDFPDIGHISTIISRERKKRKGEGDIEILD